jgi:hypothetical protein
MTSKSGFLVLILISGCCLTKACGEGQISASPRSSEGAPTPDQPIVDEPTPDQSDVAGTALEPENTQGDSWETIYENCTNDAYDPGFRPPIFVRPTLQNTGANCPDTASGCPSATLVEWSTAYPSQGSKSVDDPGTYENFYIDGALRINASNVTLRNFILTCNTEGPGLLANNLALSNLLVEYGTIQKGSEPCKDGIQTGIANSMFSHVHIDQHGNDGINSGQIPLGNPVMFERGLITRPGDNGGYGSGSHSDVWQYWNNGGPQTSGWSCWLGSRVVPSYCPNFYKSSNVSQSSLEGPGQQYIYNNWLDGSTNVMIGGDGRIIRNNKFGNFTGIANYWGVNTVNEGGNTYECDGSPLTDGQSPNLQPTCAWGFDNDPVIGWDGQSLCGLKGAQPCDGQNNPINCTGTVDSQPIDPTEFCTSDGSGCIVTPTP